MKLFNITLLFCISINCYSQHKIFNTKVQNATRIQINGGNAEIKNVQNLTVGTIILQKSKTKYYFADLIRQKDSSGIYTTQLNLKHLGDPENIYVDIGMEFDKAVNSVEIKMGIATNATELFANSRTWYTFKGFVQSPEKLINLIIKSNDPIFIKLIGVNASQN